MKSEHCSSSNIRAHWKCEQGGCDCRCHETVIYSMPASGGPVIEKKTIRRTRKLSPRGNWLVVTYLDGEIWWAQWVQTWAGVQASKRNSEKDMGGKVRVIIVDIERMIDFAVTEGANEISDLERLLKLE